VSDALIPGAIWVRKDTRAKVRITGVDKRAVYFVHLDDDKEREYWVLRAPFLATFRPSS